MLNFAAWLKSADCMVDVNREGRSNLDLGRDRFVSP